MGEKTKTPEETSPGLHPVIISPIKVDKAELRKVWVLQEFSQPRVSWEKKRVSKAHALISAMTQVLSMQY